VLVSIVRVPPCVAPCVALLLALAALQGRSQAQAPAAPAAPPQAGTAGAPSAAREARTFELDGPVLALGGEFRGVLPADELVALLPELGGWVTVEALSDEGDVGLAVLQVDDERIGWSDEDSGDGPDARLSFPAQVGKLYALRVVAQDGLSSRFLLRARPGRSPGRPPEDEVAARIERYLAAAPRAETPAGQLARWKLAGLLLVERGQAEAARTPLQHMLRVALQAGSARDVVLARSFLAQVQALSGEPAAAEAQLLAALPAAEALGEPDLQLLVLGHLALVQEDLGRDEPARQPLEALLALARQQQQPLEEARAQVRLARLEQQAGDLPRARAAEQAVHALLDGPLAAGDGGSAARADETAGLYLRLGALAEARGEPARAAAEYEAALALQPSDAVRWPLLGQWALAELQQGRYARGRGLMERLLRDVAQAGRDPSTPGLLAVRAAFAAHAGELDAAVELYGQLLLCLPQQQAGRRIDALLELAEVHERRGEPEPARGRLEQARVLAQETGLAVRADACAIRLAALHARGGALETAGGLLREALAAADARHDRPTRAAAQAGLGALLRQQGEVAAARPLLEASVSGFDALGRAASALAPLAELALIDRSAGEAAALADRLALAERLCDAPPGSAAAPERALFPALAQDLVALRLARLGQGGAAQPAVRLAGGEPVDAQAQIVLDGFLGAARWKERAVLEGVVSSEPGPPPARIDRAAGLLEPLADQLGGSHVLIEYVEGCERLSAYVLDDGRLLLLDLGELAPLREQAGAFAAGLAGRPGLAGVEEIAALGRSLHARLLEPVFALVQHPLAGIVVVPSSALAPLPFEALVSSIAAPRAGPEAEEATPSGTPLGTPPGVPPGTPPGTPPGAGEVAPAAALRFEDLRFVADTLRVGYAASTPALLRLASRRSAAATGAAAGTMPGTSPGASPGAAPGDETDVGAAAGGGERPGAAPARALLVGGAASDPEVVAIAGELLALRHDLGREQAQELQSLLAEPEGGSMSTPAFDLYVGGRADAEPLRRAGVYDWIHVAAEGRISGADAARSRLLLGGPGGTILFSLSDVLELQLDADLVLLPGLQGGELPVQRGRGLQSLAEAFVRAGARAVIASRWPAEAGDEPGLLQRLYSEHVAGGAGPAEALAAARRAQRHDAGALAWSAPDGSVQQVPAAHPHFWAGYAFVGGAP